MLLTEYAAGLAQTIDTVRAEIPALAGILDEIMGYFL